MTFDRLFHRILLALILTYSCLLIQCQKESHQNHLSGPGDFFSLIDNDSIAGTLYLPGGSGPFPVLIVVGGSGDEPRSASAPFADILNPVNFAVYVYDKRGIGDSSGSYVPETRHSPEDFLGQRADDIVSIIDLLKKHTDIDPKRVGLLASSQGTWVSMLVLDKTDEIAFTIMTNGGVVPSGWEFYFDSTLQAHPEMSIEEGTKLLDNYQGPDGYDPRATFEILRIPIGFFLGGQDRSHPTIWERDYLQALDKTNVQVYFYPNSNHELMDITTNEFNPNLFPDMISWLQSNVR